MAVLNILSAGRNSNAAKALISFKVEAGLRNSFASRLKIVCPLFKSTNTIAGFDKVFEFVSSAKTLGIRSIFKTATESVAGKTSKAATVKAVKDLKRIKLIRR